MEAPGYVLALTSVMDTEEGFERLGEALEDIDFRLDQEGRRYFPGLGGGFFFQKGEKRGTSPAYYDYSPGYGKYYGRKESGRQ